MKYVLGYQLMLMLLSIYTRVDCCYRYSIVRYFCAALASTCHETLSRDSPKSRRTVSFGCAHLIRCVNICLFRLFYC